MSALYSRVFNSFMRQGMMLHLGAQLARVEPGLVEIVRPYSDKVTQQQDSFQGGELRAIDRVVKGGKRLIITTAEVLHVDDSGKQSPCAVMQQTLMPVPQTY